MRKILLVLLVPLIAFSCKSPEYLGPIETQVERQLPDYPNALERMRSELDGQPVMIAVAGYPISADAGTGTSMKRTNDTTYFDVTVERATVDTMELLDASVPPQKLIVSTRNVKRIDVLTDLPNRKSNRIGAVVAGLLVALGTVLLLYAMESSSSSGSSGPSKISIYAGLALGGLVYHVIRSKGGKGAAYGDSDNAPQRRWIFK